LGTTDLRTQNLAGARGPEGKGIGLSGQTQSERDSTGSQLNFWESLPRKGEKEEKMKKTGGRKRTDRKGQGEERSANPWRA